MISRGLDRSGGTDALLALPWVDFNVALMKLTEAQVEGLLARERTKRRRLTVLLRLASRLSRLRRERERRELIRAAL
jgi:hypothetical protein